MAAAIVVLAALSAYANTLVNDFVFDDLHNVVDNHWITSPRYLPEIFSTHVAGFDQQFATSYYRPLMHVLFMATYAIFGLHAPGFHLVNVLIHAGNCLLLYLVAVRVLPASGTEHRSAGPLIAAVLFAVHPIHVESVAWISGITDVSSTFFFLLAFYLYIVARREASAPRHLVWLAALSVLVAALGKEIALVMVAVFPLSDLLCARSTPAWSERMKRWAPLAAAVGVYLVLRTLALRGLAPANRVFDLDGWEYLLNAVSLVALYASKLFAPVGLTALYDFRPVASALDGRFLAGVAVVLATLATAIVIRRSRPGVLALAMTVVPVLPVLYLPALGPGVFAERYLYLPSVGFVLLIALAVGSVSRRSPGALRPLAAVVTIVAVLFFVATVSRNTVWRDSRTLWTDVVSKAPENPVAHRHLGFAFYSEGNLDAAIMSYQTSLRLDSSEVDTYVNLGAALSLRGEKEQAAQAYRSALLLRDDHLEARANLCLVLIEMGRVDDGIRECEAVLAFNPDSPDAHHNLGIAFIRKGLLDHAIEEFQAASRLDPTNALFRDNLERAIWLRDGVAPEAAGRP